MLLILLCAAAPPTTWAQTARVALLRVEIGPVKLDGKLVSTPQLVEEGAQIVLEKGARARLQLMEGQGEVSLTGPRSVTVRAAELAGKSRKVKRGDLSGSLPDIGNTTRAASSTTREDPLALNPERGFSVADLVAEGNDWVFPVKTTPIFFQGTPRRVEWTVGRLEMRGAEGELPYFDSHAVASGQSDGKEEIRIAGNLIEPGQRYVLKVEVWSGADSLDPLAQYKQPFRLLSQDEKASLALLETQANQRVRDERSVLPLLELSTIFLEWDQLSEADRVLKQLRRQPGYSKLPQSAQQSVKKFQKYLDDIWDRPPYRENKCET